MLHMVDVPILGNEVVDEEVFATRSLEFPFLFQILAIYHMLEANEDSMG